MRPDAALGFTCVMSTPSSRARLRVAGDAAAESRGDELAGLSLPFTSAGLATLAGVLPIQGLVWLAAGVAGAVSAAELSLADASVSSVSQAPPTTILSAATQ